MSLPSRVSNALLDLLKPIAHQLGEQLGATSPTVPLSSGNSLSLSTLGQQIKRDPRLVKAQINYLKRQAARKQELVLLSVAHQERLAQIKQEELQEKREISGLCRELMRDLQAESIKHKLNELQAIWDRDTWFSNLSRQETEQILQQQHHRLLILVSPAKISEDCPDSFRHNLNIELPAKLRSFLSQFYPPHSEICPVQFYGDYFKYPISDIDVERLQTILSPVPTIILYSDISDYEVNFHVGLWGLMNQTVSLIPMQPWNWEDVYNHLQSAGKDEKQSLRTIRQIIVSIHKLLVAFFADLYYLSIDFNYEPQLGSLDSEFTQEWFSQEWVKPYVDILNNIQKQQHGTYNYDLRRFALNESRAQSERRRLEEADRQQKLEAEAEYERRTEATSRLKRQTWNCVRTLQGHSSFVNSIAISPDSQLFASGSWDKTIKLWNLQTGELSSTLAGHSDRVNSVAVSPDGKFLASGSFDETIKLWKLPSGELIRTLNAHGLGVSSVAISPNGELLASCGGDDHAIKLWKISTGELLRTLTGHLDDVNAVVFSPDGKILASGSSDATSKVWDVQTGKQLRTLSGLNLGVNSIAISPDGQILASVRNDYTIKLRNLSTGRLIRILNNNRTTGKESANLGIGEAWHILSNYMSRGNSVAMSPDGKTLASGSDDNTIKIWNLSTGELMSTLEGHSGTVYSVAISANGRILVSGSGDETIKIWHRD